MASAWIVEGLDGVEDGLLGLLARLPMSSPCQLVFDGFEEGSHCRIVGAVAFATHGGAQTIILQQFLVFVAAILATTVAVVDAALRWPAMSKSHLKGTDTKIALEAIAHSPTNNPA